MAMVRGWEMYDVNESPPNDRSIKVHVCAHLPGHGSGGMGRCISPNWPMEDQDSPDVVNSAWGLTPLPSDQFVPEDMVAVRLPIHTENRSVHFAEPNRFSSLAV